ncbi:MAG: hypothetical protein WCA21_05355 [Terracidiphilus sp.]
MNNTARIPRLRLIETPKSVPQYEVRIRHHGLGDTEIEVWRMPSLATPQLTTPTRLAGLRGEALELVEHRVFKQMQHAGLRISSLRPALVRKQAERQVQGYNIPEELALTLGLLFRVLAPMRSRPRMRQVAEGVEAMEKEEASYWLSMAIHRKNPRRVLTALRYLLTDPLR